MYCHKCNNCMRKFSDKKLNTMRYKKYKCDRCNIITELTIDKNDTLINVQHYEDATKFS